MRRLLLLLSILVCSTCPAFGACTFDLLPGVDYPTGADTRNFVVARLNGDAFLDVAMRVEQTDKIRILLGTENGGFGESTEIPTGRKIMFDLEAGDFNNDNITDLVMSNSWLQPQGMPAVNVLLGKGDGTFHDAIPHNVFQNPEHLSLADFNHDGKLDVAAAKDSAFVLLLGQGDGTLVQKADVTLLPDSNNSFPPDGITHADFDGDGHLDVAVPELITDQVHVFFGVGDGSFVTGPLMPLTDGFTARALTSGDYDGDGDGDLAYGQSHDSEVGDRVMVVFLSNGSARTFQDSVEYGVLPNGAFDAQSADIDGDGDLDVILANISNTTVMFNDGNGAFPDQVAYGFDGFEATAADVNRDGGLDLVVAGFFGHNVSVFMNFCAQVALNLTSSPRPSTVHSNATFTATVVPPAVPAPTGTLTLKRGDVTFDSGNLATSLTLSRTLNTLPEGTHTITALYSGDTNFAPATRSIEHVVELPPFGAPMKLSATSTGGPVTVAWTGTKGVDHYEVWRSGAGAGFALLGTTDHQSFSDSTASPSAAWLYKVRGVPAGGGTPSPFSNVDLASTFSFTDEAVAAGVKIRRAHVTELRNAVNAARLAAGLGTVAWTDLTPIVVRAIHFTQLRSALDEARAAAGMPPGTFSTLPAAGTVVKALHVAQLRTAVR